MKPFKRFDRYKYFILVSLVVLIYIPTFSGEFILDDNHLVKNNPYIKELHSIKSYFLQEDGIVDQKDLGVYHTGYYRPLINLTYWLDHKIWGMKASGFRITNLFLHSLTVILFFLLLNRFIKNEAAVFFAALFFAVHPVNTETVSIIVSRNNILVTLFGLLSFYLYLLHRKTNRNIYLFISVMAFTFAIFSKEFGVMLLPIFFLYSRIFYPNDKKEIVSELIDYIPFIIVLSAYLVLRHVVIGDFLTPFGAQGILSRIYFVPFIIIWNLRLLFLPFKLHQMDIAYPDSFLADGAIISTVLFLSLCLCLIFLFSRGQRLLLFSGLSFLIALFPVLHIINSASTPNAILALRWLYFPFSFLSIGLSFIIQRISVRNKRLFGFLFIIVLIYLGSYSYVMNSKLWHNEKEFLAQEVLNFGNLLHAGGYAETLFSDKNYSEAEKYFEIAIDSYPSLPHNYINYSALLIETGRSDDAIELLRSSKDLIMTHHEKGQWANNMGIAFFRMGKHNVGLKYLEKSVQYAPEEVVFLMNLGGAYGSIGEYEKAVNNFEKALGLSPSSLEIQLSLARSYLDRKDYDKFFSIMDKISEEVKNTRDDIRNLIIKAREMRNNSIPVGE